MSAASPRVLVNRRTLLTASAGMAGILATGRAPVFAQAQPKKLSRAAYRAINSLGVMFVYKITTTLLKSLSIMRFA